MTTTFYLKETRTKRVYSYSLKEFKKCFYDEIYEIHEKLCEANIITSTCDEDGDFLKYDQTDDEQFALIVENWNFYIDGDGFSCFEMITEQEFNEQNNF